MKEISIYVGEELIKIIHGNYHDLIRYGKSAEIISKVVACNRQDISLPARSLVKVASKVDLNIAALKTVNN